MQDEERLVFMQGGTNPAVESFLCLKKYNDFLLLSVRFMKSLFSWVIYKGAKLVVALNFKAAILITDI